MIAKYFSYWIVVNYGFAAMAYFWIGDWVRGLYWIFCIGVMACAILSGR
jgi:hypothetical protein